MGTYTTERIIYIDTLRAFALMGILFVHVAQLYNFYNPEVDLGYYSSLDEHLRRGLLAVIAIALPLRAPFYAVFCGAVVFYILQTVFAVVWLRKHKYGPWEWLWRWLTERCSSASSRS